MEKELKRSITRGLLTMALLVTMAARADNAVLGLFVGEWDVQVHMSQPVAKDARHTETYTWALDGKFIRGETDRKFDGSTEISFGHYDEKAEGYAFWVFSSNGGALWVPPGKWNADKRTLTWTNPSGWDLSYDSRCHFPDRDTRQCYLKTKDWKGKVLFESQWRATRRAR